MFLDPELNPFFRIMIGLTEKGLVKETVILDTEAIVDVETPVVVFFLKPNIQLVKTVATLAKDKKNEGKHLIVFLCPRYTVVCKEIFEEYGVIDKLEVYELPYEFIPIEKDVLTLEDNFGFRNLCLGLNYQTLTLVKHSIQRLEAVYGKIPLKYGKGVWSCMVLDALTGKEKDVKPEKEDESQYTEVDALVMMDRTVDLYTPLITQLTYEGIIDEFFGIKCATVEVDNKVLEPETKGPTGNRILYLLSQEDIMFAESRDLNFNLMKEHFPKRYEEMKSLCEKKESYKTVAEMTEYMRKLRNLKIPQLQSFFNISKESCCLILR